MKILRDAHTNQSIFKGPGAAKALVVASYLYTSPGKLLAVLDPKGTYRSAWNGLRAKPDVSFLNQVSFFNSWEELPADMGEMNLVVCVGGQTGYKKHRFSNPPERVMVLG